MSALAALLLSAVLSTAPQERDWPSSGGFDVLQLEEGCAAATTYDFDGRSPVKLSLIYTGEFAILALASRDWSNRDGQSYSMVYLLDEKAWTGDALGFVEGYADKGFTARFPPEFLQDFAAADDLFISTGDGATVVTHVSLDGSAGAVATLRRCADYVQRQNAERDRRERRWDYIAPDPFAASPAAPLPAPGEKPADVSNVTWQRAPDLEFPERAASRGIESGTVTLTCSVQANGSATNCSIVDEDPSGAGFGQAALRSMSRARFSPRTVEAVATGGTARFTVRFSASGSD